MQKDNSFIDKIFSVNWIPFGIIISLGFILYFQAFFFDFSYLDDNALILGNTHFLGGFSNIFQSFQIDVFNSAKGIAFYYRPLLNISFIFDYSLGGITPFIYHFSNVWLHILATCLLFTFLKKLDYRKDLAFLFSIIFLVHPVLTQAVAWIPGRNDSLLAVFLLACLIFFLKYLKGEKISDAVWSLIFLGLALFTKESAIFILPIMLFYFFFIYRERKISLNRIYFFLGSVVTMGLWFISRHLVLKDSTAVGLFDMIKSVWLNLPAVIQLIGKIFLPFNLSVLPVIQDTTFIYGIVSIVVLITLIFLTKTKRWYFILFGFGWFFAFLLPSFVRPNSALVADFIEHRLYVPIIGIFIVLLETDFIKKIDTKKKGTFFVIGGLVFLLSLITLVHTRNFVNRTVFWKNAAENSPHYPLAHRNLGAMQYLDGDLDNAEKEFKIALGLNPNEEMVHNNLGLIYANQGKLTEAETEYKKEIKINPYYDDVYFNLGLLYWNQKKYEEARNNWKKTLEINPNYVDATNALEISYHEQ